MGAGLLARYPALERIGFALVLVTVALSVVRGVPVAWDARPCLRHDPLAGP